MGLSICILDLVFAELGNTGRSNNLPIRRVDRVRDRCYNLSRLKRLSVLLANGLSNFLEGNNLTLCLLGIGKRSNAGRLHKEVASGKLLEGYD